MVVDTAVQAAGTLDSVLRAKAAERPDDVAFRFVDDPRRLADPDDEPDGGAVAVTYGELHARAGAIAAALAERTAPGERAVLLFPPGPDYVASFFGCLYAGVAAVPAYLPVTRAAAERLGAVVGDARPALFLTHGGLLDQCTAAVGADVAGVAVDALPPGEGPPRSGHPDDLAFLQYTSGSTGNPRGVMVSHANLLANIAAMGTALGLSAADRQVSWLPPYHDMGLILGILQPIVTGAETVLMSPFAFLVDPLCWLEAVTRFRATYSGGPNFAFDHCVRKATDDRVARLDLSSWRVAPNGAEPVRAATLARFADRFAPAGFDPNAFLPGYGLAEATLMVTGRAPGTGSASAPPADGGQPVVSVGRTVEATTVVVVDPATARPVPDGTVGEVWVAGPGVTHGYWGRPEETAATFGASLAGGDGDGDGDEGTPYLRTGDLAFLHDGELHVTGRSKDLIILRGQNLYPQDVEETVWQVDDRLRPGCAAAFGVDVDDEERLVVVAECAGDLGAGDRDHLVEQVRRAVARDHGARLHELVLIAPKTIAKTSSGKIQRRATKAAYLGGGLQRA